MKVWCKFIFIPIILFFIIELIGTVIIGFIFPPDPMDPTAFRFIDLFGKFICSSIVGSSILFVSPDKNNRLPAILYCVCLIALALYLAISSHGNQIQLFGVIVTQKFSVKDIAFILGLPFGLFAAIQGDESDENLDKPEVS